MTVRFRSVRADRYHSVSSGSVEVEGLVSGLNVVVAPNASGKSTVAAAAVWAYAPDRSHASSVVRAVVDLNGASTTLDITGSGGLFPQTAATAPSYLLSIERMLDTRPSRDGDAEADVIDRLLGQAQPARKPSAAPLKKAADAFTDSAAKLRELRGMGERLADEERGLEALQAEIDTADRASRDSARLKAYAELHEASAAADELAARLKEIEAAHPGISFLTERAEGKVDVARSAVLAASDKAEAAACAVASVASPGSRPNASISAADDSRAQQLDADARAGLDAVKEAARQIAAAEQVANAAAEEMYVGEPPEGAGTWPQALTDLAEAADRVRTAQAERSGARAAADRWAADYPEATKPRADLEAELETRRQAVAPHPFQSQGHGIEWPAAVLLALSAGAAAYAVFAVLTRATGVAIGLITALLVAVVVATLARRRPGHTQEPPGTPDLDSFKSAVQRLERSEIYGRLVAASDGKVADSDLKDRFESLGLRPGDIYHYAPIIRAEAALAEARRNLAARTGEHSAAEKALADVRAAVVAMYERYGYDAHAAETPESSIGNFRQWFKAAKDADDGAALVASAIGEYDASLDAAGIAAGPDAESRYDAMQARIDFAADYRSVAQELATARASADRLASAQDGIAPLLEQEGIVPEALPAEVRAAAARLDAVAGTRDDAMNRRTSLKTRLDGFASSTGIATAEVEWSASAERCDAAYEKLRADTVSYIAETWILNRAMEESAPELLNRATAYLEQATDQRYSLEHANSSDARLGRLRVRDCTTGSVHGFDTLSSGTKVHVSVALRLGLLAQQEQNGEPLPLWVDEPLAVSDAARQQALARILADAAKERQVIVLTHNPADVHAFRSEAPGCNLVTLKGEFAPQPVEPRALPDDMPQFAPAALDRLDLRRAINAHLARAVLPAHLCSAAGATVGELAAGDSAVAAVAAGLERARRDLARTAGLLEWHDIERTEWATPTFGEQIRAALDAARGRPAILARKLEALRNYKKKSAAQEDLEARAREVDEVRLREVLGGHLPPETPAADRAFYTDLFYRELAGED